MRLEPIPSTRAPICIRSRARSCTCGSEAALWITVEPGVSAAAIRAFSLAITDGSSMKKSHARRPPRGARSRYQRSNCTSAPRARKASRCGSSRRRPITSPPGGGMWAEPKRASSGPAARKDARMRSASEASTSVLLTLSACNDTVLSSSQRVLEPRSASSCSIASTSRMRGTLCRITSSSVRRLHASSGSAAFLLPAGTIVPDNGTPPSIRSFSMMGTAGLWPRGWARVTAMSEPLSRDQAWDLFCSWTESESLRRHVLAVEAAMRAYARRFGEDEERWGLVGMLHDLDYERYPDLETGHPRMALEELRRQGFSEEFVRAVASHADFLEVSRDSLMEKTLYAVDELSGFVMACAYVRPEGIRGMTPKSVKKKMKTPAFAAAVDRDELRSGAAELGVDFDEHVALVIAALDDRAGELGLEGRGAAA